MCDGLVVVGIWARAIFPLDGDFLLKGQIEVFYLTFGWRVSLERANKGVLSSFLMGLFFQKVK